MSYRFLGLAINYDDLNKMQVFLYRLSKRGRDFWPKWLIEKAANIIKKHVCYYAPERTGALRRSIEVKVIPPSGAVVVVGVEYAPYVEAGTRPHMIYPRKPGGVLRFTVSGEVVFAKYVRHPGFPGRFFIKRGLEDAIPEVEAMVSTFIQEELDKYRAILEEHL